MNKKESIVYLTFDDGPHPTITPFVLNELKNYDAKATFFCIGKNVLKYPLIYQSIITEGHAIGNHTHTHPNGFAIKDEDYIADVMKAATVLDTRLFRPPYGRLRSSQSRKLKDHKIIMWDVLSGDFDERLNKEDCLEKVMKNVSKGSIVVFHDSEKAWERVEYVLPKLLSQLSQRGFKFAKL